MPWNEFHVVFFLSFKQLQTKQTIWGVAFPHLPPAKANRWPGDRKMRGTIYGWNEEDKEFKNQQGFYGSNRLIQLKNPIGSNTWTKQQNHWIDYWCIWSTWSISGSCLTAGKILNGLVYLVPTKHQFHMHVAVSQACRRAPAEWLKWGDGS